MSDLIQTLRDLAYLYANEDPNTPIDEFIVSQAATEIEKLQQRLAAAESELNRLRCAMNDEKVASGVLSAFWRRVYGAANFTAFDKQVLTAHMLTALSGIDIFSKRELAETVCPDCGPVSVNPDVFNNGIPVSGICPYCKDRLHFAPETMSGEV